jgi:hypothetical protein
MQGLATEEQHSDDWKSFHGKRASLDAGEFL